MWANFEIFKKVKNFAQSGHPGRGRVQETSASLFRKLLFSLSVRIL
jgi:hypothetical protein